MVAGLAAALLVVVPASGQDLNTLLTNFLVDLRNGTWGIRTPITSVAMADGTSPLPSYTFASEPTLGIWRQSAGTLEVRGNLNVSSNISGSGDVRAASGSTIYFQNRAKFASSADGLITVENQAATIGSVIKADALPVASACGTGSPAVVAGSTPFSGSVTVGTGGPLTCTITFGGTAYPSAPHCNGAVETTTAANARAIGYSSSTTVLTIVPATAWADSSVVNWHCVSSK